MRSMPSCLSLRGVGLQHSSRRHATTAWGLRLLALRIICRDFLSLTAVTEQVLMM